jgi:hypothetical protein
MKDYSSANGAAISQPSPMGWAGLKPGRWPFLIGNLFKKRYNRRNIMWKPIDVPRSLWKYVLISLVGITLLLSTCFFALLFALYRLEVGCDSVNAGMSHKETTKKLKLWFKEEKTELNEMPDGYRSCIQLEPSQSLYRYSFVTKSLAFFVIYDRNDRVEYAIPTYE